jgi:hypothetical protein
MTLSLLAFAIVQTLGLYSVIMAVRRAPVAIEDNHGFHVIRHARASLASVVVAD